MKRFVYLAYYIKKLDFNLYFKFLDQANKESNKNKISLVLDSIYSVFKYNISLLEYFQFRFFELQKSDRMNYAGTGFMYEYQLYMNPKKNRQKLEDKRIFLDEFSQFIRHKHTTLEELERGAFDLRNEFKDPLNKVIIKSHDGQCGKGVEVVNLKDKDSNEIIQILKNTENNIVEEYVVQHDDLMKMSPSGLNTIRIFTQLNDNDEVDILGCRLRISVNSIVDNLAAGNIVSVIDENEGILTGAGVYSDITKIDEKFHPVTKTEIEGFKVPFWRETLDLAKSAAKHIPECKSIGWDIAITNEGPELIEGNHDWCKLVWQLPAKKGLKPVLEKYIN